MTGWIPHLAQWADDRLTALRLRWALAESDWAAIEAHVPALSAAQRNEGVWRYWHARALDARGDADAARAIWARLAGERSYYGFLSADRLGQPYAYREQTPPSKPAPSPPNEPPPNDSLPNEPLPNESPPDDPLPHWAQAMLRRVQELRAIDELSLALAEWTHALPRLTAHQQFELARIARARHWYRLAIDAANASRHWDALDLRFPLAFMADFERRAESQAVPVSELMAIARRESAFSPIARSPVGARGLMQLRPATGIALARRQGLRLDPGDLYRVDHNLDLGSAYYRQLLDRFDGYRPLALAAYNAGPNRVRHWIGRDLPLDAWIETIPYRDTRDYVKAVLAYSVVFDHRLGRHAELLTEHERRARL